jgi:hypothetical protein
VVRLSQTFEIVQLPYRLLDMRAVALEAYNANCTT